MKVATVLKAVFFLLHYAFVIVVEGLDVPKIPSRSRDRIRMNVLPRQAMVQPNIEPFLLGYNNHNPLFQSSSISAAALSHERRKRGLTQLYSKNSDGDADTDSSNDSEIITEESDPVVATDKGATPKTPGRRENLLDDFLYGANYVNSQYLSILWEYSIVKTLKWTVPIAIALWMNQGFYNSLFGILRSILAISALAARLLQLPLEFAQSILLNGWNVSPEAFAAAIIFLPNAIAVPLVQLLLSLRAGIMLVVDACCENNAMRFLSSMTAILVWRPSVEEWQYRSVLDKLLFGIPRWMLAKGQKISPSAIATIRKLKTDLTTRIASFKKKNITSTEEADNSTANSTIAETGDSEDEFAPFLPDESTRILLGSILFATTRLGWLSIDPTDTVALSNSPYGFTIGFLSSIGSLFSSGAGSRDLRILILLLALHQTISTFFVAQHVFAGIYRRRGLVASVGAHVSWTVNKGTIPFRLLWKFGQSTSARANAVWSAASFGSSSPAAVAETGDDDNDSNPSEDVEEA